MIVLQPRKARRGLTVVAVLICLIVITLASGTVLRVGLAQRDLVRAQERRLLPGRRARRPTSGP